MLPPPPPLAPPTPPAPWAAPPWSPPPSLFAFIVFATALCFGCAGLLIGCSCHIWCCDGRPQLRTTATTRLVVADRARVGAAGLQLAGVDAADARVLEDDGAATGASRRVA